MKFDRIVRTSNDAVAFVVRIDKEARVAYLDRWDAKSQMGPTMIEERCYDDAAEGHVVLRELRDEAKRLSRS